MVATARTATLRGIDALPVEVEVDTKGGVPSFILVGLPDKAVQESKERVYTAIQNSGLTFPNGKVVCNLAPGDLKKEGPALDLPIAIAVLAASHQVPIDSLSNTIFFGELSLDGNLRHVDGAVNMALLARELGAERLILPACLAHEAAVVPDLEIYAVERLIDVVEILNGALHIQPVDPITEPAERETRFDIDFSEVKGQRAAIRALEIVAAGGHNILMKGPPGTGKTMLARRLPTILPPLSLQESIAVTRIYSAAGAKPPGTGLIWRRPFRSPHSTTSYAAIVGGGTSPKPGEVSLAHLGVLFMDEFPEYQRDVLESLRQPLEDGVVTVSRVQSTLTFPAESILVAAMNPCPCGFKGYPEEKCIGANACERYAGKISGPLMDRIDLHVDVPRLKPEELTNASNNEPSEKIRERVMLARERQTARFGREHLNAKMAPREVQNLVQLDEAAQNFMQVVSAKLGLSARVFDRLLKVARTIADLAGSDAVTQAHLSEAVQYRASSDR